MTPETGATSASGSRRDLVERGAAVFQALQLKPRLIELHAGHGAARRQDLVARQPPLDDGDLLIEFALALAHVGDVDRLHRRRDIGEHVALLSTACPGCGKPPGGGDSRPADRGLHVAAGIRIGNDPARQFDGAAECAGNGQHRADRKDALRGLRHENAAVRQPRSRVALRLNRGFPIVIFAFMRARLSE